MAVFLFAGAGVAGAETAARAGTAAGAETPPPGVPASAPAPVRINPPAIKPHLALVLSGGGARGAAHIGVLKVLEELHVRPDIIVGTSMGSIVGGLYAAGYTPEEIENILNEVDWKRIFIDRVDRDERSFRRKQDDATFLIPVRLRFKGWKPYLPSSLLGGQRLELLLRSLAIEAAADGPFDNLPIPFRAVAADLENGHAVVIDHGSLAVAMRASMSIAGIFPPEELDGLKLIDGGAAANLPVGIAQALGADTVIAVDITSPLVSSAELGSLFQIFSQWTGYVTNGNRIEDLKRLRPGDILVRPELGDISFADFKRAKEAVAIGEEAARASINDLRRFAVDDAAWAAFMARHHRRPKEETVVEGVKIENSSWVDDRVVQKQLKIPTGVPFDPKTVSDQVMGLSGLDYFGTIRDSLEEKDGRNTLTLQTPAKPYGRNSLQFGVSFKDDFAGDTDYTLAVRHLLLAANTRGGEWENVGQMGDTGVLRTEFYQPFDYAMKWFGSVGGGMNRRNVPIWEDGSILSEYRVSNDGAHLDFGRVFGRWGEARVGSFYAYSTGTIRVGSPIFPDYTEHDGGYRAQFTVDTLDAVVYPHRGVSVVAQWYDSLESMGADAARTHAYLKAGGAATLGRITLYPVVEGCANLTGTTTLGSACELGGFLRLSGLGQNELLGDRSLFGGLIAYVAIAKLDLGALTQGVYAGLSLETGNVYAREQTVDWQSLMTGGSVFLGARTALGPVYLGYGVAEGGRDHIYFLIGQKF
jgi:NTE family protein